MNQYDPTAWQRDPDGFLGGMELSDYDEALLEWVLALPPHRSLLDVGCLCGRLIKGLRDRGYAGDYLGVDITPAFIATAQQRLPNELFREGDVRNLNVPDKSTDVVLCSNVLMHLDAIIQPMEELFRVARQHVIVSLYGSPDDQVHANHFNGFLNYYYPDEVVLDAARRPSWVCAGVRHFTAAWDGSTIISQFHFAHEPETIA